MKRGRRRPLEANMSVAGRIAFAAACLHMYGPQGGHTRALLRASGISACSAAVKKRPHAVCAEAFVMPCNKGMNLLLMHMQMPLMPCRVLRC